MKHLFAKAKKFTPGGVHSPVRSCSQVGTTPLFWHKSSDAWLIDTNNKKYIDYICGFGPVILGHADNIINQALSEQIKKGTIYGGCHEKSQELCEIICNAFNSVASVRLMNSGTEACLTAIRIARAATNKDKIIKCEGSYHGHGDAFLVAAGSGSLTLGKPSSLGVPQAAVANTLLVPFNDLSAIEQQIEQNKNQIAAIILEPICGNMGMILPSDGYLLGLRKICDKNKIILIFDEVMTGFRVAYGGAQIHYNIKPDLTVLGKVIGGGMPIGAVAGSQDLMDLLSPVGGVYQAGTFSANPMSVAAGLACLQYLSKNPGLYNNLNTYTEKLVTKLIKAASDYKIPLQGSQLGGMMGIFFAEQKICNQNDAKAIKQKLFKDFYLKMLQNGVVMPPSAFEAWFVTLKHGQLEMNQTVKAATKAFAYLAGNKY